MFLTRAGELKWVLIWRYSQYNADKRCLEVRKHCAISGNTEKYIALHARSIFKKVQAGSMKPLHYFFRELLFAADASRAILSELRRNLLMIQYSHENSNRSILWRSFETNSLAGIEQQCLTLLIFKWGFAFCCDTLLFGSCMTSCFGWSVSKQREWQRAFLSNHVIS